MRTTATKCETAAGFTLAAVAAATAQCESRDMRGACLALAHESKRRVARILRLSLRSPSQRGAPRVAVLMSALTLAACAPTYAPHIDAPAMPSMPPPAVARCATIAPLDPPPQLPDVARSLSSCPAGSGFAACFTPGQDAVRRERFRILHDDRDYCRDAYARAVKRCDGSAREKGVASDER